jgi:hypothetical protein
MAPIRFAAERAAGCPRRFRGFGPAGGVQLKRRAAPISWRHPAWIASRGGVSRVEGGAMCRRAGTASCRPPRFRAAPRHPISVTLYSSTPAEHERRVRAGQSFERSSAAIETESANLTRSA